LKGVGFPSSASPERENANTAAPEAERAHDRHLVYSLVFPLTPLGAHAHRPAFFAQAPTVSDIFQSEPKIRNFENCY